MANGTRTSPLPASYFDEPFTDQERAAAGLPEYRPRRQPSFSKAELRRRDAETRRRFGGEAEGAGEGARQARPRPAARRFGGIGPAAGRAVSGKVGGGIASAVLGLAAYAIGANYLTGGWPQVKGWFSAKFENKPYQGAANPIPAATSTAPAPVQSAVVAPLVTV